ncbi:hypothetical protein CONPUDRAFT_136530 [Coniophora puteana RWD-64-598 SS2]|uniref:N-acetyltransferase domain-containing protein n=1 Tax=Coniophora puteana (strain RWD-64-598) TaxID=741705 RepID=A0A5M3MRF6_CONPW|nr:uncharacterized protein CONPUDRAFT_136530 [Coniophora puteana RWD-64-598 SS2]EIW81732.1 hypothetical protein CONPUDRAFT_136530 [Coniophora puteana RWD-64-598 SS2]
MVNYSVERVDRLTDEEIEATVDAAVAAIKHSNSALVMMGTRDEDRRRYCRAVIRACLADGDLLFAREDGSRRVVGMAVWFPPGRKMKSSENMKAEFDSFVAKLPPAPKMWWEDPKQIYSKATGPFLAEHLAPYGVVDSWYCTCLVVHPDFQRNGIGSSLIEAYIEKLYTDDRAKDYPQVALCTDTDRNIEFYKRLGFELKSSTTIPTPLDGVFYPVHCMSRCMSP